MILTDTSSIIFSSILPRINEFEDDKNMIRHIMLNIIRRYNLEFREAYGEMILCFDSKMNWRRTTFPQYKANRRKNRKDDNHDWSNIFEFIDEVREDIINKSPFRCIMVDKCEADDIIGTIVENHKTTEPILILSPDHDFKQLQKFPNITQYSNVQKKYVVSDDPEKELFEKICKGDVGDGVPNILSDDDCLVNGDRQSPMTKNKIEAIKEDIEGLGIPTAKRFIRNKRMIDLSQTPDDLKETIMESYKSPVRGSIMSWMTYMTNNKMKMLLESMGDFEVKKYK